MTKSTFTIRQIFDESWEFFKQHYEYLLPFSLIFFVIQSPTFFIDNPFVVIPITLILLPLGVSIPYYADHISDGGEKIFSVLFDTVRYFFKILIISILKFIFFAILFAPFLLFFVNNFIDFEALKGADFININEKLNDAIIKSPDLLDVKNIKAFLGIGTVTAILALLVSPILMFPEYYAVLDNYSIMDSFKKSIQDVSKNYFKVLLMLISLTVLLIVSMIFTCESE